MKVVILDTETTGFKTEINQIGQLAYLIIINGEVKSKKNFFFTVDKMDKGAENTHGFSIEKLKSLSNGKRFSHYAQEIFEDLDEAMIVCHNSQFDIPFIQIEFERIGVRIKPQNIFCTMKYYTNVLKIKNSYGYKWPTLTELLDYYGINSIDIKRKMNIFYGETSDAHDARWDIIATMEIYNRIPNIQTAIQSQTAIQRNDNSDNDKIIKEEKKQCITNKFIKLLANIYIYVPLLYALTQIVKYGLRVYYKY